MRTARNVIGSIYGNPKRAPMKPVLQQHKQQRRCCNRQSGQAHRRLDRVKAAAWGKHRRAQRPKPYIILNIFWLPFFRPGALC
jgi:hypothetical protein